jgi:UDP-glucose:(heptosyl)LPS alpha-1,3-glucosyltransferase
VKIALGIVKLFPRGGLEDHAFRIADELAGRGHAVAVFTTGKLPEAGAFAAIALDRRAKPLSNHGRVAAFAADFEQAVRGRFDRIVGFHPMPGLDLLFLADHLRDRPDTPRVKRILPRFRTYARLEASCFGAGATTRIMGLAEPQMRAFAARYPGSEARIVALPPTMTDLRRKPHLRTAELRRQAAARLGMTEGAPALLWLGLQPHVKGLDRVIAALPDIPEAMLLVGGVAAGDRKLAPAMRQAETLGVTRRIRWLGYVPGDEVPATFAAADLLAHPARVDVTGGVILEALTNGLPVVATDCCGFSTHVEASGSGKVVPAAFDPNAFVAALREVCGPQNADMSRRGLAYGESPDLFSGLAKACDLIEATEWPREITLAGRAAALQAAAQ